MVKKVITYTNYEDEEVTETHFFHLNKFELLELETYTKGGLIANCISASETNNVKKVIEILTKIILKAYGIKDPESNKFKKSPEISNDFKNSEAFAALFYELAENETAVGEFLQALVPKDLRKAMDLPENQEKVQALLAKKGIELQ